MTLVNFQSQQQQQQQQLQQLSHYKIVGHLHPLTDMKSFDKIFTIDESLNLKQEKTRKDVSILGNYNESHQFWIQSYEEILS